ncbi:uncharacterized protein BCR38DRAFT_447910 [Pseudomassariella vexata]|uniref:Uncharacterized protein n=1 Tax=Pseudomassariella vexata TaxID=1141098 RepID=A0A1Y2DFS3_9PEZI|nr:uncharacterized protein BCR38DRAFT_447910 [Pseudomassariella vexata]ORY58069.1 hypothetical protein BCR38DRAFT_447910 [Pseudomassariella vexata]
MGPPSSCPDRTLHRALNSRASCQHLVRGERARPHHDLNTGKRARRFSAFSSLGLCWLILGKTPTTRGRIWQRQHQKPRSELAAWTNVSDQIGGVLNVLARSHCAQLPSAEQGKDSFTVQVEVLRIYIGFRHQIDTKRATHSKPTGQYEPEKGDLADRCGAGKLYIGRMQRGVAS